MTGELEEIWALYADDGAQSLDAMETSLACLRSAPADTEAVGSLFRAMHTFKGNSRILGLAAIEAVAHAAEDLVGLVRDEGVSLDHELSQVLLEATDVLRGMMEQALAARADANSARAEDLLQRMKAVYAGHRYFDAATPLPSSNSETSREEDGEAFTEAMIFDGSVTSFADDPLYREIFFDIVRASLAKVGDILAAPPECDANALIAAELIEIREAALRIGFANWPARIDAALSVIADAAALAAALQVVRDACGHEAGDGATSNAEAVSADVGLENPTDCSVPAEVLAALRNLLGTDLGDASGEGAGTALALIEAWAQDTALPGLADACASARTASDPVRTAQALYILGDGIGHLADGEDAHVVDLLGAWCSRTACTWLPAIAVTLPEFDSDAGNHLFTSLQMFASACRTQGLPKAAEAAQALAETAGRMRDLTPNAPPALAHLVSAFVSTARALWGLTATPDCRVLDTLERVLQETATAAVFLVDGAPASAYVPAGLPPELARSLSPESLEALAEARASGQRLHILRADVGENEALGERFALWLMAPKVRSIASATIFDNDRTLFDFLVATVLSGAEVKEALREIDPDGQSIQLTLTLDLDIPDMAPEMPAAPASTPPPELSETIGSFAVAHACIRQSLDDCIEADVPGVIDTILSSVGDMGVARERIGRIVGEWQQKLQQLIQVELQASRDLERLTELATQSASGSQSTNVIDAMVVRIDQVQYVLPFQAIDQIITFPLSRVMRVAATSGSNVIGLQNGEFAHLLNLRAHDSAHVQPVQSSGPDGDEANVQVVVTRSRGRALAVLVDELVGQQTVHPHPLSGYLDGMQGISGYAILKTGDIGMLLDVNAFSKAA